MGTFTHAFRTRASEWCWLRQRREPDSAESFRSRGQKKWQQARAEVHSLEEAVRRTRRHPARPVNRPLTENGEGDSPRCPTQERRKPLAATEEPNFEGYVRTASSKIGTLGPMAIRVIAVEPVGLIHRTRRHLVTRRTSYRKYRITPTCRVRAC